MLHPLHDYPPPPDSSDELYRSLVTQATDWPIPSAPASWPLADPDLPSGPDDPDAPPRERPSPRPGREVAPLRRHDPDDEAVLCRAAADPSGAEAWFDLAALIHRCAVPVARRLGVVPEDVAQEATLKVWLDLEPSGVVVKIGWLHTKIWWAALDVRRRVVRVARQECGRVESLESDPFSREADPYEVAEWADLCVWLRRELSTLPEDQYCRSLCYLAAGTQEDAAAMLGISRSAVSDSITRAIAELTRRAD